MAASEIHKAGQQGSKAAKILFANMGFGGFMYLLGAVNVFSANNTFPVTISALGKKLLLRTSTNPNVATTITGGATLLTAPDVSPAYLGVGYIIGPRLAALNFAGGVLAWGLLVPLLTFIIGPYIQAAQPAGQTLAWTLLAEAIYYSIVRPIAVGGMLVGASYTLFKMRKQLGAGMARAVSDLKKSAAAHEATNRTDRDLPSKAIFAGVGVVFLAMIALYYYFIGGAGNLSSSKVITAAVVAALVMIVLGFFFAAVSGNLVGMIGSSNNPVSGLTLCTLVIAALLMVALGVSGTGGVAAVLGVAAVVCVSSAVAGEMLQDLKVGSHSGRHARQDADRRSARRRGGIAGPVLSAGDSRQGIPLRQRGVARAAGRIDGHALQRHCGRRHGVAAGDCRDPDGHCHDHDRSEERDAVRGRNVFAAGDDVRDFRGRRDPLGHRQAARPARLQRCAKGARGERRCADGFRTDRGRGAVRAGHRRAGGVGQRCDSRSLDAFVLGGPGRIWLC